MKRNSRLIVAASLAGLLVAGAAEAQNRGRTRYLTIHVSKVSQLDNLDKGDVLSPDRADFKMVVWVDGRQYTTKNFSWDDGNPRWTIRAPFSGNTADIRIRLLDDDGGLEEKDDHVDINPISGMKDLNFTYNASNRRIRGDVTGRRNVPITAIGKGDDDRGRITFTIR